MKLLLVLVILLFGVLCQGRTINLKNFKERSDMEDEVKNDSHVSHHKVSPTRFVPVNNIRYFKEPCEDGFKRDVLGICREVWD